MTTALPERTLSILIAALDPAEHPGAWQLGRPAERVLVSDVLAALRGPREVPAGEIQEAVEVPGPTLSHHLDILRRAGLVQSRREERYVYYSVRRDTATALVRLLTACC